MKLFISTLFLACFLTLNAFSQTRQQHSGWLFILNSTKFNDKWGAHLDVQLRSEDNWDGLRNFLFRPGVTYYIDKNSNATLGYLLANTYLSLDGLKDNTLTEHRIWEQYILTHKIKTLNIQHRFRLEQRFMETNQADVFAQRLRYFFRFVLPIGQKQETFTKGPFVALQNELFFNVQNKSKLNNHFFDQNRAYGALGYRFSKSFDLEAGYMNQATKGTTNNTMNNIVQLAVYTRF
ncbi:DUF2490 domain-containing protein [Pedobacter africanus]|uniref:DUF2490 domain-containing protein n=1 Tax=Pedobacter africanus TaxID=151894 RepID=A0A1W2BXY3_9SPHI|nr:DUF2490 domain-containing protein [Pedobacter africanus]SMC77827.1 Protein of unknown function [Pedobacter africanus]